MSESRYIHNYTALGYFILLIGLMGPSSAQSTSLDCQCKPCSVVKNLAKEEACRIQTTDCVIEESSQRKKGRYIKKMIRLLEQEQPNKRAAATAVYVLGELRASSAIPVLIKRLEHSYMDAMNDLPYRMANPPEALIKIGEPALQPVIVAVRSYEAASTQLVIASMLHQILNGKTESLEYLNDLPVKFRGLYKSEIAVLRGLLKNME